jgi:hypothetical protein
VACAKDETTRKPGPGSFTSALIWALNELGKKGGFDSAELRQKIIEAEGFPKDQHPDLFDRVQPNSEHVWIASPAAPKDLLETARGKYREDLALATECLDVRLYFNRLDDTEICRTAAALNRISRDSECGLTSRRISLKRKFSLRQKAEEVANHWLNVSLRKRPRTLSATSLGPSDDDSVSGTPFANGGQSPATGTVPSPDGNLVAPLVFTTATTESAFVTANDENEPLLGVLDHESESSCLGTRYHFRLLLLSIKRKLLATFERLRNKVWHKNF